MTKAARMVLKDCRDAANELIDGVQGGEWRRRWILVVVLLRAVGHVLEKVDGKESNDHKKAIEDWWDNCIKGDKQNHIIFWEFIEEERNSIIKEYKPTAGQGITITLSSNPSDHQTSYDYKIYSGYYAGKNQREVLNEAFTWWELQLNEVDKKIVRRQLINGNQE